MSHSENTTLHADAVTHLQDLAGRLLGLLDEENSHLRNGHRAGFLALQPMKAALAEDYELTMKAIRATKTDLKAFDDSVKAALLARHEALQEKADRNLSLLEMARATTSRLQTRVLAAARAALAESDQPAYSRAGRVDANSKGAKATSYTDAV